jgi:hypothetical protein
VQRPAELAGRRSEIAGMAGWEIRDESGHWRVRTAESYRKQQPTLLTARHIRESQFDFLGTLPEQASHLTASSSGFATEELKRLRDKHTLASEVARFQLGFLHTPTAQLPDVMETFFSEAAKRLPRSELLVVDVASELSVRYNLAKLLITAELAPAQQPVGAGVEPDQGVPGVGQFLSHPLEVTAVERVPGVAVGIERPPVVGQRLRPYLRRGWIERELGDLFAQLGDDLGQFRDPPIPLAFAPDLDDG